MRALRILLRWPIRGWLHRRCLKRIAALELDIWGPHWLKRDSTNFTQIIDKPYEIKPGAVWPVSDPAKVEWIEDVQPTNYVQILAAHDQANAAVKHKMAAMNLLYSGASWCLTCGEHGPPHAHEAGGLQ